MADSAVVITSGSGTNIDTRTESTNGNHRQVIVVGDPDTNSGVAPVSSTNGLSVTLTTAIPAGTAAIGKLAANSGVDIGDVDVTSVSGNVTVVQGTGTNLHTVVDSGTITTVSAVTAITNALPAGNNNIGDVDIASLPALAAGTNNIGDVDVLTLPSGTVAGSSSLPAGTNNIGDVDVLTLPSITGTVTANAGTNLNTSLLALESGGNLAAIAASASVLDDWDESDRAKVNPIAGQAGVQGGSGTVNALTQRVVLATDVSLPAGTNLIGYMGHGKTIKNYTGTISATTSVIAVVTSKRIKVISVDLITASTTAVTVTFKDGAGGTAVATYPLQAITGTNFGITKTVSAPSFLFATSAGVLLEASFSAAQSVTINISYFDDDAT